MKHPSNTKILYFLVVLLPFVFFLFPILEKKSLFWGVSSLQFIPWRTLAIQSVLDAQIPFLNPFNGLGSPLLANYQLAFFYPLNWLQFPFFAFWGVQGIATSYNFLVPLHLALSAFGLILFLRSIHCSPSASAFAALSYSLSGYLIARISFISIIWTLTWLPWLLYSATALINTINSTNFSKRKAWWQFIAFTSIFATLLLAGHAQTAWYSILISAGWCTVYGYSKKMWKGFFLSLGIFIGGGLFASLISAIQLIPTWEFLQQSQRADSVARDLAMMYSFWPWRLITFIMPDFFGNPGAGTFWGYGNYWEDACYIGLAPLFFSIYAIFQQKNINTKDPEKRIAIPFFSVIAVFAIILSLGKNTPVFGAFYDNIPTFNMFQAPSRWIVLSCFSLVVLSGIGLDLFIEAKKREHKKTLLLVVVCSGVIIAGFTSFLLLPDLPGSMTESLIRAGALGSICLLAVLLYLKKPNLYKLGSLIITIIILTGIDLFTIGFPLIPFTSSTIFLTQQEKSQTPLIDSRIFMPPVDEYDLKFSRFFRTHDFRPIEDWQSITEVGLPDFNILSNLPYINNFDPLVPASYQLLMDYLRVAENNTVDRWLDHLNAGIIEEIDIESIKGISYSNNAHSHFYYTYSCNFLQTNMKQPSAPLPAFNLLHPDQPMFQDIDNGAIIADRCIPSSSAEIQNLSGTQHSVDFLISNDEPTWIELSVIWYPGWAAYQDGSKIDVYKVNGILLGTEIDAGTHKVEFKYEPGSYRVGLIISTSTIVLLLIVTFFFQFRNLGIQQHD
jgi:hypothetical protein